MNDPFLHELSMLALERKQGDPKTSYTARLYAQGEDAVLKKFGEEAIEMILAAKSGNRAAIVHESADMLYHCLLALAWHGIELREVEDELRRRRKQSGLEEKTARPLSP
ncbi:MAG: phosphoribosyl-ATP diphosphatase [Candidatus Eutrophobiaceae bacterium]